MAFLNPEEKKAIIEEAAELGIQATVIKLYGEHVFFLRRNEELIVDHPMDANDVRDYLEELRQ